MTRKYVHPIVLALGAMACALATCPVRAQAPAAVKAACLTTNETREEIRAHHLLEPFVALKSAAVAVKAEAISAKLCRLGEEFVYEISLLHRDGRLVHVVMGAVSGKLLPAHASHETPPRT